jgi:hypothetical protein
LLQALEAIVSSRPDLSWAVRQDAGGGVGAVGVTLSTPGAFVVGMPTRSIRDARDRKSSVVVPLDFGIRGALALFAQRTKARVGFESIAAKDPLERTPGAGSLDVTSLPQTESVSRIVASDSRYTWTDAGGVYNVRPAPHIAARSPLDRPVEGFTASDESIETVLERIITLLGGQATGRSEGWGSTPGSPERLAAEAEQQRHVSFQLGPTTVREILNTLCRTQGTLSWTVTVIVNPNSQRLVSVSVNSWNGWGPGRSFTTTAW